MNTKLNTILRWLKIPVRFFIVMYFLIIVFMLPWYVTYKLSSEKQVEQEVRASFDHESLIKRLEVLEKQSEKQSAQIKKLEVDNDALHNSNKVIEKRLQSHVEVMKRLCEYVVIITVDKKILPRQCATDYRWSREEGN